MLQYKNVCGVASDLQCQETQRILNTLKARAGLRHFLLEKLPEVGKSR